MAQAIAARSPRVSNLAPGLALTAAVATVAVLLQRLTVLHHFSPLIIAVAIGVAFHNVVGTPAWARAGVVFGMKKLLRLAIILLGLQLTAGELVAVGWRGLVVVVPALVATFFFTQRLGRFMGVDARLTRLIAAGTSICGASAVLAANAVTDAPDEDVTYAIGCITLFGSISMFVYPLLPGLLDLDPRSYGLWTGASIHEIAQVVAAAFQNGEASGQIGTVSKMLRVVMLAPMVLFLGWLTSRAARTASGGAERGPGQRDGEGGGDTTPAATPMPWFILGFLGVVAANSLLLPPPEVKQWGAQVTAFLLAIALAGMGLDADLRKVRAKGLKPIALAAAATSFIACVGLALVKLTT